MGVVNSIYQHTFTVATSIGGFIPARMLRTELKIPILAVSLELYDDATKSIHEGGKVKIKQWFDEASGVAYDMTRIVTNGPLAFGKVTLNNLRCF